MKKVFVYNSYLRVFAAIVLLMVVTSFIVILIFVTQRLHSGRAYAVEGSVSLASEDLNSLPVMLSGAWEWVSNPGAEYAAEPSSFIYYVEFPVSTITQAKKAASYRLRIQLGDTRPEKLYIYIPTLNSPVDIFLNGVLQTPVRLNESWVENRNKNTVVQLLDLLPGEEWQELVISGDFSTQPTTLYKRPVYIGTSQNTETLAFFDSSSELFLLGVLILVLLNGLVFMLFRPEHRLISLITLFDIFILIRVLFSMKFVMTFIEGIFPEFIISDTLCSQISIASLMVAGIMGCLLSGVLYDPENSVPRWLIRPPIIIYGVFAVLFPLSIFFFETVGHLILIAVYAYTFVGVLSQYRACWKRGVRLKYYSLQYLRTAYIGVIICVDILCWTRYIDFIMLLYLYVVFFLMHVVVRLYDNNQSYRDVEILNQNLESTVQTRTAELSESNRILSELSRRDPLTGVFNRLYFEMELERAFESSDKSGGDIHLCMFDLDRFKSINDTYGHSEGDEQLKYIAGIVSGLVGERGVFARIGGEEFMLLFTNLSGSEVMGYVTDLHRAIETNVRENPHHTTASFGVVSRRPAESIKALMKRVDVALYEAKDNGRNCIVSDIN